MANTTNTEATPRRSGRGFAGMDAAKQREIAAKGGRAAHRSGNAHEFDSEEARAAGRAGGRARALNRSRAAAATSEARGTSLQTTGASSDASGNDIGESTARGGRSDSHVSAGLQSSV